MARVPRLYQPGVPIQRGNNRQVCFAGAEDFAVYAGWFGEYENRNPNLPFVFHLLDGTVTID